jgi:hypothetical protein
MSVRTLPLRLAIATAFGVIAMALAIVPGTHQTATVHAQAVLNDWASTDCTSGNFNCNYCSLNPATAACSPNAGTAAQLGATAAMTAAPGIGDAQAAYNVGSARTYCPNPGWYLIGSSVNLTNYLGC